MPCGFPRLNGLRDLHFDCFGFGLLGLGQVDEKNPVLEIRRELVFRHVLRQRKRAEKASVRALNPMKLLALLLLLLGPFALDAEDAVLLLTVIEKRRNLNISRAG